jgi:hypothetical protein
MNRSFASLGRPRSLRIALVTGLATVAALALTLAGAAGRHEAVPPPPANPTSADQIQNIDQVKTAIKAYYGDTTTAEIDPVPNDVDGGDKVLHTFSPTSAYANELGGIVDNAQKYLARPNNDHGSKGKKKAVLFDVDDTTLNTFSYEIYSNFSFNPGTNAFFVNAGSASVFPAVPGMVGLEKAAEAKGYDVYFLTGRPISQTAGTLANLTDAGYDVDPSHVFLKDTTAATEPWLASCVDPTTHAFTCSTIQYKSLTRQHIEQDLGANIIANFGDQFSDLTGGFADRTFKIPNPMYFLP